MISLVVYSYLLSAYVRMSFSSNVTLDTFLYYNKIANLLSENAKKFISLAKVNE